MLFMLHDDVRKLMEFPFHEPLETAHGGPFLRPRKAQSPQVALRVADADRKRGQASLPPAHEDDGAKQHRQASESDSILTIEASDPPENEILKSVTPISVRMLRIS